MRLAGRSVAVVLAPPVASLLFVLCFSTAAQALAPPPSPFTGGSLKSYLVGVPSSVLGAAESSPLEGAESANLAPYVPGADDSPDSPDYLFGPPDAAPVEPAKPGSGAGFGALLVAGAAWEQRAGLADDTLSVVGINANSAVCNGSEGVWTPLVVGITGQDCSAVNAPPTAYVPNGDQPSGLDGESVCSDTDPGWCAALVSVVSTYYGPFALFDSTGTATETPSVWYNFPGNGDDGTPDNAYNSQLLSSQSNSQCEQAAGASSPSVWCFGRGDITQYWFGDSAPSSAATGSRVYRTAADPDRKIKCTVVGSDGVAYSDETAVFHESDGEWPQPLCPVLPPGVHPVTTTYYEQTAGQPDVVLGSAPTTPQFTQWADTNPTCTTGGCVLDLRSATSLASCNEAPAPCAGWFTDPSKAADWQCTYNAVVVDLSECNVLAHFYDPESLQNGELYSDPLTGAQEPGSSSTPGLIAPGTPVQNPEQERQCFPSGWGALNPVNWVLEPFTCALQWAFVPRASALQTDVDTLRTDFDNSPPGKLKDFAATLVWPVPAGGGGCSGITVDFSQFKTIAGSQGLGSLGGWDGTANFLDACPGTPLAPYAGWVSVIVGAVFVFGGILASLRLVGRLFGYTGPGSGQS